MTLRVAFTLISSTRWTGGYNYLLNLFAALAQFQSSNIKPVLFCGEDAAEQDLLPFKELTSIEVIRSTVFNSSNRSWRLLDSVLTGNDSKAARIFSENSIDVVFENAVFYGWRFSIPVIAWMPDFQHRRLRDHFGFSAYWRRELGFRMQVFSGRLLMLSSEDARSDCESFYPGSKGRTAVVRFAVPIPDELVLDQPEQIAESYKLPMHFFFLPNQFWKHKNHGLVLKALEKLKASGIDITVAATGNPNDPRHPDYLAGLMKQITCSGLEDSFRILGMIPRSHVISLMRCCIALINPSRFEGWSSTVEEARYLQVRMLLSDIKVHREQMGNGAEYFSLDNPEDLAEKMLRFFQLANSTKQGEMKSDALSTDPVRRFADDFFSVVQRALRPLVPSPRR